MGGVAPRTESTALGGLVARAEHAALGGLPLTSTNLHDFRTHEPRKRIDGLSALSGRFVASASTSVAIAEAFIDRGSISAATNTVFA